ncbi:MAG: cytochrome P450 [Hyphomicrobium sp.]
MYVPPRPKPISAVAALLRAAVRGDGDLLSLLPAEAYRIEAGWLGFSRRSILIVNAPDLTRRIMADPDDNFPKNDLMVGALEPLVGNSIFVSGGDLWRRQRRMIDPAFSHIHLNRAFASMAAAVDDYRDKLDGRAASGETFSLDLAMSELTADVITRTVFSTTLKSQTARDVFESFSAFERTVAHVEIKRLILEKPWAKIPQHERVLAACALIRRHLGDLVDTHIAATGGAYNDIAAAVIGAQDASTGVSFTREEVIDQLGVFFLAGHETTASVLTWVFYILATQAHVLARMRREIAEVVGDGPVEFEHTKRLPYVRNVFRETLRLYPPITFIPRVANEKAEIGAFRVKRGAMIMISPWTIHRHDLYWRNPHAFDPDRFGPEREGELVPGAYLPFGQGPRVCVGAAFAATESALILAELVRRFDFHVRNPQNVRPVARLTTSPAEEIICSVTQRI